MPKTIRELADELGVSKSYVDKIIRILKMHTKLDKVGNKYVISKSQEKSIKIRINEAKTTTNTHTKVDSEVDFLKEEIVYLKKNHESHMKSKDKQIEKLSSLLDQQQRLSLQDKKLLEEYKSEINELKALIMPVRKNSKEDTDTANASMTVENIQEKSQKKNKKWYKFWK